MPSSIADLAALRASSILSFFWVASICVLAPTLITAIQPVNFAMRSWCLAFSYSVVAVSICAYIDFTLFCISSSRTKSCVIIVSLYVALILSIVPSAAIVTSSSLSPTWSVYMIVPVIVAISCRRSYLRAPNPGAFIAIQLKFPLILLRFTLARASSIISVQIMTRFCPPAFRISFITGMICLKLSMTLSVTRTGIFV